MNSTTTATVAPESQSGAVIGSKGDMLGKGFIHLSARTHDISFSGQHIPNITRLVADLEKAVKAGWPNRHEIRYSKVEVLLLSWEDDDLRVETELKALQHVFADLYHFGVQSYMIPNEKPDKALKRRVFDFLDYDGEEVLLILYYAGHAKTSLQSNEAPIWFANRRPRSASLPSGGIQSMFEEADADVVLLYDCCNSAATTASSSFRGNKGVTEAISACGYETSAPEVGEHSFSNALTEILAGTSKGPPFTIAELHSQVLNRLKCWAPCLVKNGDGKYKQDHAGRLQTEYQPRRTPIYTILCESEPRRSILLAPLRTSRPPAAASEAGCNSVSDMATSNPAALSEPHMDPQGNTREVKQQIEKVVECPQILLTVRLDEDRLDLQSWKEFLRQLPAEGKDIKIEGAYRSFSTLLLLRLPITVWDLLPDHPAYSFVSFVSGENMALGDRLSLPLASKAIDPEVSETMDLLSLRRKEPGTDGSHLPEGGCRFFLLKPEGRMLRCACVSFALSQSVPGGNCECGHQAHCHVPNKESGTVEVQKRKVPKERAIMVEEKMAKGGSTHTPHSGFPSMSQMLSKIGINNPFTPPPSTRDALSSYAESSCTQEDLAPKIPAKRHSESRSPTLETYLDSEAIGQRLEAIDSGSKGSRSSGVFSRRASTSHKRYRRVDREPRYEYCWLWACCACGSQAGMAVEIEQCPEFSCGHTRCSNCSMEQVKLPSTR